MIIRLFRNTRPPQLAAIVIITVFVLSVAGPAFGEDRRTPLGSNIPRIVNPFPISEEAWYSLFIANTPTGRRLSVDQLSPFVLYYKWPTTSIKTKTSWHLTIGVFLMNVRGDGTVAEVEKLQSIGHPQADRDCIKAFKQWRFRPGSVKEVRVPAYYSWRPAGAGDWP